MQEPARAPEPVDITVHVDERLMRVAWSDGHEAVYDFEYLRWQCPCAECYGEGSAPGLLSRIQQLSPRQTELVDLRVVGRYGLTPVWADGHQTGIYTYRRLRTLCQCPECAGPRTSASPAASSEPGGAGEGR